MTSETTQEGTGTSGSGTPISAGQLDGRIALITGASRGLGAAVARAFAAEGAQTILLARTVGGLEEVDDQIRTAGGQKPLLVPHDLRNLDGLDHLGASLFERYGKLDILVGNAAVLGSLSPLGHIKPKIWTEVMEVNATANYRLIRSLDPLLRRSDAGRAIFVTCRAAQTPEAYWAPYAASKAALEVLVRSYAAEIEKTAIRANLICPGPLRTALRSQAFPGEDADSLPKAESVAGQFIALAKETCTENGFICEAFGQ